MQFYISHLVDTADFLDLLKQYPLGIESIHFSISDVLDQGFKAITSYQDELGTFLKERPLILHGPFFDLSPASFDSKIRLATMERFEEVYQVAKILGASKIIFHTGFIPQIYFVEGWLPNSIAFWKEFMSSKQDDITICIENVFEEDYTPILELINGVCHPHFKMCLDVGHVHAYSPIPLNQWIESLKEHIFHIHLHNNHGSKDEHLGLSNGTLSMKNYLALINDLIPSITITLEIYNLAELTRSLKFLTHNNYLETFNHK